MKFYFQLRPVPQLKTIKNKLSKLIAVFNIQNSSENAFLLSWTVHYLHLSVVKITVWREKLAKPILLSHWIPSHVPAKIIIVPYLKSGKTRFPIEGCDFLDILEVVFCICLHFLDTWKDKFARQKMGQPLSTYFRRMQI